MSTEGALGLFSAMFLLAIVPGTSDALVVMRAMSAGLPAAITMILGIVLADIVMMTTAILGLGTLAHVLNESMIYLHYPAGLLLIWWGYGVFRQRHATTQTEAPRHLGSFAAGFMITLADPKALLFFFALFPAFLEVEKLGVPEILLIAGVGTGMVFSIKTTYAWLALRGSLLLEHPRRQAMLRGLTGGVLCAIGFSLLLSPLLKG